MKRLFAFAFVAMLVPSVAHAQDVFPGVQYISGHAGLTQKIKNGTLVLTATQLRFKNEKGDSVLVLPLPIIKSVSNSVEQNPGSTGAKLMLGVFASKKEEFLYVNTETADAAEALVFQVKNKTSPAMVAKIQFQMKKAAEAEAAMKLPPSSPAVETTPAVSASPDSTKK
jgi:hypothetical protein